MCGILGIFGRGDVAEELAFGLAALQHRGQDAAGIVTLSHAFRTKKGLGLVRDVFRDDDFSRLKGPIGLGHVRYATVGRNEVLDAQPLAIHYPLGLAMAHNGNLNNNAELRETIWRDHHRLLETDCDLELLLYTFASELQKQDLSNLSVDGIFETVAATQRRVEGAYSTIAIIANQGFLAFADPYGLRPLVYGRRESSDGPDYAFASESSCLDTLGYETLGDLRAGEAVFVDMDRNLHVRVGHRERPAFCVFEYIYFAREDATIHGRQVADVRAKMGKALAPELRERGLQPDAVIDVPSSGYFAASGLAEELGVPYRRGFAKNNHIGRSFIAPTQSERERMVRAKLNPIKDVVKGKRLAVLDDSIVRGTTSKHLVKLLRQAGAEEVYFVSASPPVCSPCVYGIDMSIRREMIAASKAPEEIREELGVEALVYQRLEALHAVVGDLPICDACFSGNYPTSVSEAALRRIERERSAAQGTADTQSCATDETTRDG